MVTITLFSVDGNLYFIVYPDRYGWQILYAPMLFVVFVWSTILFVGVIMGNEMAGRIGKLKCLIGNGIAIALLIVTGVLLVNYSSKASGWSDGRFKTRFIFGCIFSWITFLLYLAEFVVTLVWK
ncbi:unnamed protein product, partial [Mesorhabditis belari]|uniref:Uncharacterized protein n=1 Tax=Mesorhabditis belari TaxID=2138241 RepID=A0AAF3F7V6_9BILA